MALIFQKLLYPNLHKVIFNFNIKVIFLFQTNLLSSLCFFPSSISLIFHLTSNICSFFTRWFIIQQFIELAEYRKIFLEESEQRQFLPVQFLMESQNQLKIDLKGSQLVQEGPKENKKLGQREKRKRPSTRNSPTKNQENKGVKNHLEIINTVFLGEIQQLLNLQERDLLQNYSLQNATKSNNNQQIKNQKQNAFSQIFRRSYAKREQKTNKNFVKFLLPKLYSKFEERKNQNKEWYMFNKEIQARCQRTPTILVLKQLFQGVDDFSFKKLNRQIVYELLHDRQFYSDYFFSSRYIKRMKNRKQYLLAAKVFSLRCISSHLMGRVQTK